MENGDIYEYTIQDLANFRPISYLYFLFILFILFIYLIYTAKLATCFC